MSLYKPVHAKFEKFCKARTYGHYDFQDLMQETITIAFNKFSKVENSKTLLSFLCGIAIKILANHKRKQKTHEWTPHLDNFPAPQMRETEDEKELLYFALSQLPDEQNEAVVLFEIAGFSIKEIAEIQSAGESAIKQRLARGRVSLIRIIEEIESDATHIKSD